MTDPCYGAHAYLWRDQLDTAACLRLIHRAAELRLGFLELPVGDDTCFAAEAVGEAAATQGLRLVISPGGEWPARHDLSLPGDATAALAWHRRQLDLGAACGAIAYTGALYGHPGTVDRRPWLPADSRRLGDRLRQLADAAAQRDLLLALEPMSHFRTHVCNTPERAMELIDLAGGHDALRVLIDTYHLCTEITHYGDAIRACRPRLWGLHACENNRGCPGTGFLPWRQIVEALRGWDGYLGFESYNSRWRDGAFAIERGMFHDVCPDGDAFVRQGLAFLQRLHC